MDPLGLEVIDEGYGDGTTDEDRAAWHEWVDAFAKAEGIEFINPKNMTQRKTYPVNDPKVLKSIATEVAEGLGASEREEWEDWMELRIRGFRPKMRSTLWVSTDEVPGPEGFTGQMFVINYGDGGSATVYIREGKRLPVLSRVICDAGRTFGFRIFGQGQEKPSMEKR